MVNSPRITRPMPNKHRDVPCIGQECELCQERDCPEALRPIEGLNVCRTCQGRFSRNDLLPGQTYYSQLYAHDR